MALVRRNGHRDVLCQDDARYCGASTRHIIWTQQELFLKSNKTEPSETYVFFLKKKENHFKKLEK